MMMGQSPQFSKTDLRRGRLTAKAKPPEPASVKREIATGSAEQLLLFGEVDAASTPQPARAAIAG